MGTKITVLPQVVTPVGTDELPISQDTGLGGRITYKATLDQIKGYLGSGTGSVTNVGVNSPDASIGVFGSPITSSGTISLTISSVALDKLDDGGATGGEILTYNGSTNAWEPGFGGSSGIIPNILVGNGGTTYTLTNYTNDTASNYLVFVGGVAQRPTTDFTISGSSIIFGSNIPSGAQILVYAVINIASLNVDSTPIGTVSWFAASAAPTSYLECSGGVVAISEYLDLYNVIGKKYNKGGEGASNFRLPDLRGEFIRGWDHGRNIDTGRVFGSWQIDEFKSHRHQLPFNPDNHAYGTGGQDSGEGLTNYDDTSLTSLTGGTETRPRNVALLPCIKAQKTVTGSTSVVQSSFTIDGSMLAKAWVTFNGKKDTTGANSTSNTNRLINASYNVDSVSRTGQGQYTINFKTGTFESANYAYTVGVDSKATGVRLSQAVSFGNKTISSLQIESDDDGTDDTDDLSEICFTFYASGGNLTGTANVFDSTPVGTVNWFAASAAPVGYLECDGSVVSKGQYGELYQIIKDTYTAVLSADHFRLPDLRGEFIRGWDKGRSIDTGRVFGSWQKGSLIAFDSTKVTTTVVGVTNAEAASEGVTPESNAKFEFGYDQITPSQYNSGLVRFAGTDGTSDTITNVPNNFGSTRPRNVALLPCIKAQKTVTGDVSTLNFIEKPASPTNGQVLTYNGSTSTWVASAAPVGGVGIGQTWQDVTGSRAFSTTYTNNTGKPIMVSVTGTGTTLDSGTYLFYSINGVEIGVGGNYGLSAFSNVTFIVPAGSTYSLTQTQANLYKWSELR